LNATDAGIYFFMPTKSGVSATLRSGATVISNLGMLLADQISHVKRRASVTPANMTHCPHETKEDFMLSSVARNAVVLGLLSAVGPFAILPALPAIAADLLVQLTRPVINPGPMFAEVGRAGKKLKFETSRVPTRAAVSTDLTRARTHCYPHSRYLVVGLRFSI
jgi:hypothetical protein